MFSKARTDVDGLLTQLDTRLESDGVASSAILVERLELRLQSGFLFKCKVRPLRPFTETWHVGQRLPCLLAGTAVLSE